jgi:hypothetical protein
MSRVCLVIIYNHHFPQNIERIEALYQGRFSNISHIIPFYNGQVENVITVYENSYQFQGFIAQAMDRLEVGDFDHYFFVADDMVLNPRITENSYESDLGLSGDSCFFTDLRSLQNESKYWERVGEAVDFRVKTSSADLTAHLPTVEVATDRFKLAGLNFDALDRRALVLKFPVSLLAHRKGLSKLARYFFDQSRRRPSKPKSEKAEYRLSYPLVGGYSDIFVVSREALADFAHYCGAFAAGRLFVELAIPTALVLTGKKIVTEKDIELAGRALWTSGDLKELDQYDRNLQKLLEEFPKNLLYLHPVKLSEWI